MWKRKVTKNNFKIFGLISNNATTTVAPVILKYLTSFEDKNNKYFLEVKMVNFD